MSPMGNNATGYVLLEVLITIVITVIGLLGLAGFQTRATAAESEGYQRVQALVLAQDMVDRIYANRDNAATYLQNDVGAAGTITDCSALPGVPSVQQKDSCEWSNALVGASETVGGVSIGTLLGGRGCITAGAANEYIVTVVWQGLISTVAPTVTCGQNAYGNEALRRAVSLRVVISTLSAV